MSYTIRYGTSKYDYYKFSGKKMRLLLSACLLFAVILVCTVFSEYVRELRRHLFPAFEPAVRQAFENMALNVNNGEPLHDAVVAFCREVLFEASG